MPSLIFECLGDLNLFTPRKEKPDNTTHARSWRPHMRQQFMTMIKESSWDHLTLVHVFHVMSRRASVGESVSRPLVDFGA
jgi:hypothetical protein